MCSMLMCAYTSYDINLDNYRFVCVCVCLFFLPPVLIHMLFSIIIPDTDSEKF